MQPIQVITKEDFHANKMPLKAHAKNLEDAFNHAKIILEECKKQIAALHTECNMLDYNQKESLNNCMTTSMNHIKRLDDDLTKISQQDACDCSQLKQQVALLYQDKIKIQTITNQLNTKTKNIESHVGLEK